MAKGSFLKYRAEIDGLRALAVIPVILFHAGFELFSGGFVGVDVFFVISGYLITTILIEDIEKNRFSLTSFYERRARRILPALFFVMFICIPFAWMWMLPSQMKDFSQSLIAVSFFASNILFWRESGYFDAAAEEKPLLHTWSLAVEEQYYVLFPIFLFFTWRFGKNKVFWMIVVFAAISLALSEWGWRNRATANFYLAPTRVWEILAGSIAAFVVQKRGVQANNSLSLLGLAAILFSIFAYDENTPFPSVYALVPVVGVVFLVLFAEKETLAAKLLSTKALVGIGLISYSAYLWHQPLFAFARIRSPEHLSLTLMSSLAIASIILAWVSWKFVEKPFRKTNKFSVKSIFLYSFAGILCFSVLGYASPYLQLKTFNEQQISILDDREVNRTYMSNEAYDRFGCFFDYTQEASQLLEKSCVHQIDGHRVVLFGDSEAAHYFDGFKSIEAQLGVSTMQFTGTSCRAIDYGNNSRRCREFFEIFKKRIVPALTPKDTVIVASNWWNTHRDIGDLAFKDALRNTLMLLISSDARVVIVGNTPDFILDPYENLAVNIASDTDEIYFRTHPYIESDRLILEVAGELGVKYFLPTEILCKSTELCLFRDTVDYLFFDTGHLSYYGSRKMARALSEKLDLIKR